MMDGKCSETNRDGQPCSAPPWRDGLCRWHHPDNQAAIAEGRRKGGANKSNRARAKKQIPAAMTVDELAGHLGQVFHKLIAGTIEPGVATAAAQVARSIVTVTEAGALERLQREVDDLKQMGSRRWPA